MMDWILAPSSHNDGSHELFHELMSENFNAKVEHGGLTMLTAYNARTTALANVATPEEVDLKIDTDDFETQKNLQDMQDKYGRVNLDKMSPTEFYKLYAKFVANQA